MSEFLNGTFEAVVKGFSWAKWEDEDTGRRVPILKLECEVGSGDNVKTLHPALFFDNELKTDGADAGKSKVQISLECLASYGLEVDPANAANNEPHRFGPAMVGKTVSLYCAASSDGKTQKVYMNRARRPELKEEEVSALWAEMTGAPAPVAPPAAPKASGKAKAKADDEDLGF